MQGMWQGKRGKWDDKLLSWLLKENKRSTGRLTKKWEDEIKGEFGVQWKRVA